MKLFRKIELWMPTFFGFLLGFVLFSLLGTYLVLQAYPFFALTQPLPQPEQIILEGWLPDAELERVVESLGLSTRWITTGGPVKFGGSLLKEKTYAEVTAARLRQLGVPSAFILVIPALDTDLDRTFASALAVRRALEKQHRLEMPTNLYSLGAHSRRSFLLYRLACGADVPLGVVALESESFDLRHWWRSSHAFKHLFNEGFSYFYTQCTRSKYEKAAKRDLEIEKDSK